MSIGLSNQWQALLVHPIKNRIETELCRNAMLNLNLLSIVVTHWFFFPRLRGEQHQQNDCKIYKGVECHNAKNTSWPSRLESSNKLVAGSEHVIFDSLLGAHVVNRYVSDLCLVNHVAIRQCKKRKCRCKGASNRQGVKWSLCCKYVSDCCKRNRDVEFPEGCEVRLCVKEQAANCFNIFSHFLDGQHIAIYPFGLGRCRS